MMRSSSKLCRMIWDSPSTDILTDHPNQVHKFHFQTSYAHGPNPRPPTLKVYHTEQLFHRIYFSWLQKLKNKRRENRKKTHHDNQPNHQNNSHLILLAAKYIAIEPIP